MTAQLAYLVRHGEAEPTGAAGDSDRALTAQGRAGFSALAASLAGELRVTRILASPYRRARETAELLARATGARVESEPSLGAGRLTGPDLLALLGAHGAGVALVGHNPEFAEAIGLAAGAPRPVPPGTIAALELGGGAPALSWLKAPP